MGRVGDRLRGIIRQAKAQWAVAPMEEENCVF